MMVVSGIFVYKNISIRLKCQFYKTMVKPPMLYGSEYWAVYRKINIESA